MEAEAAVSQGRHQDQLTERTSAKTTVSCISGHHVLHRLNAKRCVSSPLKLKSAQ